MFFMSERKYLVKFEVKRKENAIVLDVFHLLLLSPDIDKWDMSLMLTYLPSFTIITVHVATIINFKL
jgi:hypothetical protein